MINISKKADCCGCTACFNICPKKAIKMKEDFEGFLYPTIDKNLCVNCKLCENVCPIIQKNVTSNYVRTGYVIRAKSESVLEKSTSGGFITPLAEWIIQEGGFFVQQNAIVI